MECIAGLVKQVIFVLDRLLQAAPESRKGLKLSDLAMNEKSLFPLFRDLADHTLNGPQKSRHAKEIRTLENGSGRRMADHGNQVIDAGKGKFTVLQETGKGVLRFCQGFERIFIRRMRYKRMTQGAACFRGCKSGQPVNNGRIFKYFEGLFPNHLFSCRCQPAASCNGLSRRRNRGQAG